MKKLCQKCGLEISAQNYSRHIVRCDGSGFRSFVKAPKLDIYNCQYCDKECKNLNSLKQHEVRCARNPERHGHDNLVEHIQQRKGSTKETNEIVAKQSAKLKARYAEGKSNLKPFCEVKDIDDYIHSKHNKQLLDEWINYVNTMPVMTLTSEHRTLDSEGYIRVKGLKLSLNNFSDIKISFEHEFIANQLIDMKLESSNTIHHINKVREDNRPENLMVFIDRANHLRYHTSKYAWLIFDPETKLFSCEIRK